MAMTLKINARNDLHLPADLLRRLNLGQARIVQAQVKDNALIVIPVDLEPRYAPAELAALDRLHEKEKKKGWVRLKTPADIDRLLA